MGEEEYRKDDIIKVNEKYYIVKESNEDGYEVEGLENYIIKNKTIIDGCKTINENIEKHKKIILGNSNIKEARNTLDFFEEEISKIQEEYGIYIDVETETEYDYNYEGELYELGNSANIIYRDKEGRTIKR